MQTIPSPNNLRIVTHWHLTWRVANASFAHSLNVSSGSANNEESSARRFDVLPQTWSESCKKIRAAIDRFCASADNPGLVLCQGNLAGEQPLQKTLRVAVDESATVWCHVFKVWSQPMSYSSNVCSSMPRSGRFRARDDEIPRRHCCNRCYNRKQPSYYSISTEVVLVHEPRTILSQ